MKKRLFLFFFLCLQTAFGQTNIAVPNYSSVINSFNASGNIYSAISLSVTVNSNLGVTNTGNISVTSAIQTNNPRNRTFTFRLPSANVDCNRPLLIALHGDGGNGNGMMTSTGFNAIADAQNFISVYPDAQTTLWGVQWNKYADNVAGYAGVPDPNAADDVQFISDLIDYFYTNYGIDRNKVYVTGHSGGGFMTYSLAIANQTKTKIAGIAPVAANLWGDDNYLNTQFGAGVYVPSAVLHIHSTTDNVVDFPTLGVWTWPLASFSYATCNNAAYTTTTNSILEIDTHTFCGTGNQVILKGLKKAGLGHGWPTMANANYNASQEIWDFLKNYSKGSNPNLILSPAVSPQNVTINSGQTTTLTASACPLNTTYLWKKGSTTVSTNNVFTTPSLSTTTVYTAFCVAGNCQSIGTDVTVTVNAAAPCQSTQYVDGLVTPGPFVANQLIQASDYIIVGNGIDPLAITAANSNKLTLRAGKAITINPGIMVGNGAVFKAEIGGCDNAPPAHQTFYVDGRNLKDPCGNTIIIKGVNKMNVWTDQDGVSIPQIALTGANTVRIVWTVTYDHDGNEGTPQIPTDDAKLDNLIGLCIANKMIPMVELHDVTGNLGALQLVLNYWKRPAILTMINKYKHALLLNIANEAGDENVTAQQFEDAYKDAITQLRNMGITVPLVIDGGVDYAKNLEVIVQKASSLISYDPLHNLLFSVHTYWPMNDGATHAFITAQLEAAVNANVPFIIGELSKYGAWAGNGVSVCSTAGQVDYEWMASESQRLGIGWLAWEWGPGNSGGGDPLCTLMDMTTNNTYATLNGWGLALANNATYGLITAQKTPYILSGFQNCN